MSTPIEITPASVVKSPSHTGQPVYMITIVVPINRYISAAPSRATLCTLSILPAPKFCPTKVVMDTAKATSSIQ